MSNLIPSEKTSESDVVGDADSTQMVDGIDLK